MGVFKAMAVAEDSGDAPHRALSEKPFAPYLPLRAYVFGIYAPLPQQPRVYNRDNFRSLAGFKMQSPFEGRVRSRARKLFQSKVGLLNPPENVLRLKINFLSEKEF